MAFMKKGSSQGANIEIISDVVSNPNKVTASQKVTEVIYCKTCGAATGMRQGNLFHVGDKQFVSLAALNCIKCGKPLK